MREQHWQYHFGASPVAVHWLALLSPVLVLLEAPVLVQVPRLRVWLVARRRSWYRVSRHSGHTTAPKARHCGRRGYGQIIEDIVFKVLVGHVEGAVSVRFGAK
jgi:hypothetical protein